MLFGLVFVGLVAVAIYVVVAQSMATMARGNDARIARLAEGFVDKAASEAMQAVDSSTAQNDAERRRHAALDLQRRLVEVLNRRAVSEAEFGVYRGAADLEWATSSAAVVKEPALRRDAVARMRSVESVPSRLHIFNGLLTKADLGRYVVHMPMRMPDGQTWIIDIVYYPRREQSTIDAIRPPMFWVATGAILSAMLLMQLNMGWVLRLVHQLQEAADSIDTGRLEHRLPESGDNEIGDLARSLNSLIDRLRHRADIQTRFVADASHELATPVAGIRGYVNILQAWGGEDAEVRLEAISAIDRESRRMSRLCNELLSVIRSEEQPEYRRIRFDLNATVREVLANAATRYLDKGLDFAGPDEGQLFVIGDHDRIEEALAILVDNACKYTPATGKVGVGTRRKRGGVVVEVQDSGVGMSEQDLDNIFERFYRSDNSRSEGGGFGLGLSIAKHIIEASEGSICVASRLGEGTTFTVWLPRKPHDWRGVEEPVLKQLPEDPEIRMPEGAA